MITRLAEINRILVAAEKICDETGNMPMEQLLEEARTIAVESRRPDHERTIEFCQTLELLSATQTGIRITEVGRGLLILNPHRAYDLQPDQQRALLRRSYLHGPYRSTTRRVLKTFAPDATTGTYVWDSESGQKLPCDPWFPLQLVELGLCIPEATGALTVAAEYADVIAELLSKGDFSEEKLLASFAERKELGDLAESLVFATEVERLRSLGCIKESLAVKLISKLNADAGYDLESYDGEAGPDMRPTRFIEIKGSGSPSVRFVWSNNEIERARELGQRYWIYFLGAIDKKKKCARRAVVRIQDPIRSVLDDEGYRKTPNGLLVESDVKGAALVQ